MAQPPYSSDNRGEVDGTVPRFTALSFLAAAAFVGGLYLARDVLVPFAIAVLLSFMLAIPVRMLQRWKLGRIFPVAFVVIVAFGAIGSIGAMLTTQLTQLAGDLPRYQTTIHDKIAALKGRGYGPLDRAADTLQSLANEFGSGSKARPATAGRPEEATPDKPLPVEVVGGQTSALGTISNLLTPLLHPLTTMGLIAVFVIFMLLQRGDLRNRAIRLAGSRDLQRTTAAMNDAAARLSRFFLMQVLLNTGFGIVVGIGLWFIGVPSPALWAILAAISRFVPYVGVVLAAGGPLVLAAAVDPNWTMLWVTVAFFSGIELLVGQVVEPLLYGHSTGLSPIAVVASVTFWTWLWGPVGLLLATPLTVCLVVLGRHVDQLEFLEVMFGDRPPLTAAEIFYQRALAGDVAETTEQAELFVKNHALETYYDQIAVKGLALAQVDLERGMLDEARLTRIETTMSRLVEEMAEHEGEAPPADEKRAEVKRASGDEDLDKSLAEANEAVSVLPRLDPAALPPDWQGEAAILCLAGRNELDLACARMLAQILGRHGLGAMIEGATPPSSPEVLRLPDTMTRIVCLSYLDTTTPVHVRYAVRRLRRRLPNARIIVCSWGIDTEGAKGLCSAVRSDGCASSLIDAARLCLEAASTPDEDAAASRVAPQLGRVSAA